LTDGLVKPGPGRFKLVFLVIIHFFAKWKKLTLGHFNSEKKTPDPSGPAELPRPGVAVVHSIPKQPPTLGQAAGQDKFNKSIE